jgi:hypothetical protein
MLRIFSLKRVISDILVAKQIPGKYEQKIFYSRPPGILKAVIYTKCGPKHGKGRRDSFMLLTRNRAYSVHNCSGHWIGGRLVKGTNAHRRNLANNTRGGGGWGGKIDHRY